MQTCAILQWSLSYRGTQMPIVQWQSSIVYVLNITLKPWHATLLRTMKFISTSSISFYPLAPKINNIQASSPSTRFSWPPNWPCHTLLFVKRTNKTFLSSAIVHIKKKTEMQAWSSKNSKYGGCIGKKQAIITLTTSFSIHVPQWLQSESPEIISPPLALSFH